MIKKSVGSHKTSEWSCLQQKFSDLIQHDNNKGISKLDESHLSQQIEDDETTHSEQIHDEIEDESANSQHTKDNDTTICSPVKNDNIPSRFESSCNQDSADLFSSTMIDIECKGSDSKKLHQKRDSATSLKRQNLFSSPILENATSNRQSVIFSDSLIRCCTPKRKFNSIMSNKSPTGSKLYKSTPSGSPILKKSSQKYDGTHRRTLIPLSPITPGLDWTDFASVFSVHADETSIVNQTDEQTTLATPLDVTDEQIDDFTQENRHDKNEDVEITENFKTQIPKPKPQNVLNTTGSNWIKNVQDKIEEDWQKRAAKFSEKSAYLEDTSVYDSGKKSKIIKGGLAEKLMKVLKKENSQKSIFLQKLQTKKLQKQDSLLLKVLSDVREGLLRIVECKSVKDDQNLTQSLPYTLILPAEFADSLDLTLGLSIRVYQPFQSLKPPSSDTTVLLSAYNIICQENMNEECLKDSTLHQSQSQNYENLLNCLEAHTGCDESFSIVATIQRIFCQLKSGGEKWNMLCIDGYGTIFLVDSQNFSTNSSLVRLLTNGEGQRLIFKNLSLKDRMKRSQYPSLFSVIDSVWDPSGSGLLHCSGSHSQHSGDMTSLLPPSYCYFLSTDETSSVVFPGKELHSICVKKCCDKKYCRITSDLNRVTRGNDNKHCQTDVLFCLPEIFTLPEIFEEKFDKHGRVSIICQFVEFKNIVDCDSQDLYCSQHNDTDVTIIVKEYDTNVSKNSVKNFEVLAKNSCLLPHSIPEDSILVFRDICVNSHGVVVDQFSRVKVADCVCECYNLLNLDQPAPKP